VINLGPPGTGVGVTPGVGDPPSPGIVGVIHFVVGIETSATVEGGGLADVLANADVVRAVERIRGAQSSAERVDAVSALMEEIG
jgi:hypothetical protein